MKLANQPIFDPQNLNGIDDVLLTLERLGHDLQAAGMRRLRNFNYAYLVITRNVRQHLHKGSFEHPEFLERFDARFAYYYLHSLQGYLTGKKIPDAWQKAFDGAREPSTTPFVCMALGVNAHVNNDIPLVLRDCRATDANYADYLLVNDIIRDSLGEVIASLDRYDSLFQPRHKLQRPLFILVMKHLVRSWRRFAWLKYQAIQKGEGQLANIENSAHRIAQGIRFLPL